MALSKYGVSEIAALLATVVLAACGGGGGSGDGNTASMASAGGSGNGTTAPMASAGSQSVQLPLAQLPNAPRATGNTAIDGFNWFNFRRQQMGLAPVASNSKLDTAAQGHSNYQKLNAIITHDQIPGNNGFTGAAPNDRLIAAGYRFTQSRYAYGEVISATGSLSGFDAADGLVTAIYHRFVIFQPQFTQAGVGAASITGGYTYFTTDFTADGLTSGIGRGNFMQYPVANQTQVPAIFYSDREIPDPVPNQNEVGYPVSIHADITAVVSVQSFTLKPRGGMLLPVKLLIHATDAETPPSAAAIIPTVVLSANTIYDAQFIGTVDGVPVNRSWSFTTQ